LLINLIKKSYTKAANLFNIADRKRY
jgi:hypothetical protein